MSSIMGIIGIFYGLYFAFTSEKSGFSGYFDLPSLVLLGLLPPSIMLLSHKISDLLTGIKLLFAAIFHDHKKKQSQIINALTKCQALVRSEGVGSLVKESKKLPDQLLQDGINLIVNNFTIEEIKHNLTAKIVANQSHMSLAQKSIRKYGQGITRRRYDWNPDGVDRYDV